MASPYKFIEENSLRSWLLMSLFLVLIFALGYLGAYVFEAPIIFYLGVAIGLAINLLSFYYGDKIIISLTGAKEVNKDDLPEIYRLLENLSIVAGLPRTPKLYLIESKAMNAFATGRNKENALVALTRGLIEKLELEEIEGVISHEIAHIKNLDIKVMMLATILGGIIAIISDFFLRLAINSDSKKEGRFIVFLIGLVLAILAPLLARLIQLAISRKREFLADATGALLTKNPEGLARALIKISQSEAELRVDPSTADLFIINPFKNKKDIVSWLGNIFSTHPPIEERVKILRSMNF